jgi:hypothetical protein
MPNGRGKLDCIYCVHFDAQFDAKGYTYGKGEERACAYHQVILPKPKDESNNRICGNFAPNGLWYRDNKYLEFFTLVRQFAWFGIDLEPGVLYEYSYNDPPGMIKLAVLRIPDYEHPHWTKPNSPHWTKPNS